MAYYTGMRKEQFLSLVWDQVDLRERKIILEVGTTKNNAERIIYMDGDLYETIVEQKRLRDVHYPKCRWVFLRDGQKIKGYTSEIREDSFTLINWKTDESYEVQFNEIDSLEKKTALSTPAKIAIYGSLVAIPILILVGLAAADS